MSMEMKASGIAAYSVHSGQIERPEAPLERTVHALQDAITDVHDNVTFLAERLAPLTTPDYPSPGISGDDHAVPERSPLRGEIEQQVERLQAVSTRLINLRNRLEI